MRPFLSLLRQLSASLRMLLVFTAIFGLAYPLLITLVAQLPGLKSRADGSMISRGGTVVASKLIGQSFTDAKGAALIAVLPVTALCRGRDGIRPDGNQRQQPGPGIHR